MLAPAIEDQQLMPDHHGFPDNRTESTFPCQSLRGDDRMNEYDREVAHPGNGKRRIESDVASRPLTSSKFFFLK